MNRYAAEGIVTDARAGVSILVIAQHQVEARCAFNRIVDMMARDDIASILKANGKEEIRLTNGGRVLFRTRAGDVRGQTLDKVFIDSGTDELLSIADYDSIFASIATSAVGEIIRA